MTYIEHLDMYLNSPLSKSIGTPSPSIEHLCMLTTFHSLYVHSFGALKFCNCIKIHLSLIPSISNPFMLTSATISCPLDLEQF